MGMDLLMDVPCIRHASAICVQRSCYACAMYALSTFWVGPGSAMGLRASAAGATDMLGVCDDRVYYGVPSVRHGYQLIVDQFSARHPIYGNSGGKRITDATRWDAGCGRLNSSRNMSPPLHPPTSHGYAMDRMGVPWVPYGYAMGAAWVCHRLAMGMPRMCHGCAMVYAMDMLCMC